ncbi:MAG: response regulator [Acidobacteriia bacterium]|nr:response regulator [Terriglobia bacterium]
MPAQRLLLVDDEPALADLLKKYLERLGYQVDVCGSAEEALPRFEADPAQYDLVLSDLTLPGMSGEDMVERMREIHPELRAIVASGYPHRPRSKQTSFLQKPFLPKMLVDLIEKKLKS